MDSISVVRAYLESESGRDIPAVRNTLADDMVFESPFTATGVASRVQGADLFCGHLAKYISPEAGWYSEWMFYDIEIYPSGDSDTVFAEWKSRATVASTKAPYSNVYIGLFKLSDGLITLLREYRDPSRVVTALTGSANQEASS